MKRSPIVNRTSYYVSRVGSFTVFLPEPGQGLPGAQDATIGDYCVTCSGFVFVRTEMGRWAELDEDSTEHKVALAVWKLKNEPPPTHLQF